MSKNSIISAFKRDPLLAGAAGLFVLTAAAAGTQYMTKKPVPVAQPRLVMVQPVSIHEALTKTPAAPVRPNTAGCGPETTFQNVMFECVNSKPIGVQISNVFLRFTDERSREAEAACAQGKSKCQPVDALKDDERAGFNWWREQAWARYQPQ